MLASSLPSGVRLHYKFCSFFAYPGLSRIMYDDVRCQSAEVRRIGNISALMRLGFFFCQLQTL